MDGSWILLLVVYAVGVSIYVFNRLSELEGGQETLRKRLDLMASRLYAPQPAPAAAGSLPSSSPPAQTKSTPPAATPTPPPHVAPVGAFQTPASQARPQVVHASAPASQGWQGAPAQETRPQPPPPLPPRRDTPPSIGDLESRMGASWMARLGTVAIALGVAFLLQYAFPLIGPGARVLIGLAIGLCLYGWGQFLIQKPRYNTHAQVMSSGGIVIFFLSIYAAHNLYHLIGYWEAFAALAVPTLLGSVLAIANNAQAVAIFCVLGAFAAPLVLHSGQGAPDPAGLLRLYAYMGFLNVWVAGMVRVKPWHSLPVLALASTWTVFFFAGPDQGRGWAAEAFAALFLLLSVAMGVQMLQDQAKEAEGEDAPLLGVWLILGGCLAFMCAGLITVGKQSLFGWPAPAVTGLICAMIGAGLATGLTGLGEAGRRARSIFAYFSGAGLLMALVVGAGQTAPIPRGQAPVAFGFAVFTLLLFAATAAFMARKPEGTEPAVSLVACTGLVHLLMVFRVLDKVVVAGLPAACVWLPLAGWAVLMSLLLTGRHEKRGMYYAAAALAAQALAVVSIFASPTVENGNLLHIAGWNVPGAALVAAEFLLMSGTWLALRRRLAEAPFRADLLGAYGNAVVFYTLLWTTAGLSTIGGVVLAAGYALAMALYHAFVGAVVLRTKDDDYLHRLAYLGIGVTFLTISIPLQLKMKHVTTVAWAVEAVMLIWAGLAAREYRARYYGVILLSLAGLKALCMDLMTTVSPFHFLFNSRMLAGAAVVVCTYLAARMLWQHREELTHEEQPLVPVFITAANLLTLIFVSADLWEFASLAWPADGHGAAQLALSIFWTVYALGAVSVGIWKRIRAVRLFAMGLLYLSIFKVFLYDLAGLEQPYRIFSFLTLGFILLAVSLLYTRFEERLREVEEPTGPPTLGKAVAP